MNYCGNINNVIDVGMWPSLVGRLVRDEKVVSSNLAIPTNRNRSSAIELLFCYMRIIFLIKGREYRWQ